MTTDITELAQREKFEAWWEREYKHLESSKYTDAVPHIKYGFWMAYQAGGAELVEALEKAQQRISEFESPTVKLPQHYDIEEMSRNPFESYRCIEEVEEGDYVRFDDVLAMLATAGIKWEAE